MNHSLAVAIDELYRMFDYFNANIYNGELKRPVFIIASKRSAYGWCSNNRVWKEGEQEYYEIGITAEFLNRTYDKIAETTMHEMVHLYNSQNDVKDCSGQVHNKKFKAEAERRHLHVEKLGRYGWSSTSLTDVSKAIIDSFPKNQDAFKLCRVLVKKPEKDTVKPHRYICPQCGTKFQSKDEVSASCKVCNADFVEKEAG